MPRGWARCICGDQETRVEAGDVAHQDSGISHFLFDYLLHMEYLEIVSPANFKSIAADPLTL